MVALIMFGIVCTVIGSILTLTNIADFSGGQLVIGWLLVVGGFIMLMIFNTYVSEETGYKIGQKDALSGIQNIEVRNTYVDTSLVKSDTVFIEGFKYK